VGEEIFNHRKNKFLTIGRSKGFVNQIDDLSTLSMKESKVNLFIKNFFKSKLNLAVLFGVIVLLGYFIFSL
jgi:acetyl-CoA carboxylase carboxyl transferase subunit alpha